MKNKHIDIIKSICLILCVLGTISSTLYNGKSELFVRVIDYLSKPFVYPVILFILGYIIYDKDYSKKTLLKRSLYSFLIGLFINIFCFSIIYFIRNENYLMLENLFRANIFIFISLMYLFFYVVRNYDLDDYTLWGMGLLFSILNTLLSVKNSIDSNVVLESITSIFYSSSNHMSFSFLPWIIFPITGYIFKEITENKKDNFYILTGIFSSSGYVLLTVFSKISVIGSSMIDYDNAYSVYNMNIYYAITSICLCIFLYSMAYLVSKKIPSKIYRHIKRWSKNIVYIYIIVLLMINYVFLLLLEGMVVLDAIETSLLFAMVFIISDVLSYLIVKKINRSK